MLRIVVTRGRKADREDCGGYSSLFLTPCLIEEFYYVTPQNTFGDLKALPRFAVRRPTGNPFRIAGPDGHDRPVVELRFKLPRFSTKSFHMDLEQTVEFVH